MAASPGGFRPPPLPPSPLPLLPFACPAAPAGTGGFDAGAKGFAVVFVACLLVLFIAPPLPAARRAADALCALPAAGAGKRTQPFDHVRHDAGDVRDVLVRVLRTQRKAHARVRVLG